MPQSTYARLGIERGGVSFSTAHVYSTYSVYCKSGQDTVITCIIVKCKNVYMRAFAVFSLSLDLDGAVWMVDLVKLKIVKMLTYLNLTHLFTLTQIKQSVIRDVQF